MKFSREFAMPNRNTFSLLPVGSLLDRWLEGRGVIIDPFSGNSKQGTITNDLNSDTGAEFHLLADVFLDDLIGCGGIRADAVLFDPPYSPRQISECYKSVGLKVGMRETQNGRLYKSVKARLDSLLRPGGVAICCGWNSMGFGLKRGYEMREILLVSHGGAHNDTIVTVEVKGGRHDINEYKRKYREAQKSNDSNA